MELMCGTACAKHSTFWFTIVSFLLAVYSPPGRLLKRKSWVLFLFHLLSLSRWSPHLPQCLSTSVSVALSPHLPQCLSTSICRVGLHTCHSVCPLLSLSRWSPHLPQCLSTSVSVALVSTLATVSVHFCLSVALVSTLATVSVHSVLKRLSHCPCDYPDRTTECKHSQWLLTA